MRKKWAIAVSAATVVFVSCWCFSAVIVEGRGTWPDSWPQELEQYRAQAKTFGMMEGMSEDIHEIPFFKRKDFEQAWPHILELKTTGAPIILEPSPSTLSGGLSTAEAGVRVLCPGRASSRLSDGKMLETGPPWPDDLKLPSGGMPEYVVNQDGKWVASGVKDFGGFRARLDIVLIVDGKIVDLNRIPLPADTPIIDKRFKKKPDNAR